MGHNVDVGRDHGDRLTYAQAAAVLGVHVSTVAKLIARGDLTASGRGRGHPGSLDRAEVEQLAQRRRAEAEERAQERAARAAQTAPAAEPVDHRPDPATHGHHHWLTVAQTAQLVGLTEMAIRKRVFRGTIPHVRVDDGTRHGRVWIRADHARIAANVQAADPEHLTVALEGLG